MSNDPNALQKAEAAKLTTAQHAKAMRDAAVCVKDATRSRPPPPAASLRAGRPALRRPPPEPAAAVVLDSANGYGLVGRQGIKAGAPRQPLAIALPMKAEAVIGLSHNPGDAAKFPADPR
jgi:hypothetical protein